jgi:hypothetical protein
VTRVVIAALAAVVVSLTLSIGIRHTVPASPRSVAACLASAHGTDAARDTAGRCGNHDGAERFVTTATSLPGPTSLQPGDASSSRVQPPPANRRRALAELAVARAHDPTHLHTYSLLI